MHRRPSALALALALVLSCQPAPTAQGPAPATADAVAQAEPADDALTFPPPQLRRERRAMPRRLRTAGDDAKLAITAPELDDDNHFEFAGQTLRISFNGKVHGDPARAAADLLTITPAVAGKASIIGDRALEFVADAPFDPEADYTIALAGLRDEHERPVLEGWTARFRADPQVWIGGKMLSYLPKPGEPRIVAIEPSGGLEVGTRPRIEVLFDQPVDPSAVAGLVTLERGHAEGGAELPVKLKRGSKSVFAGIKIDKRHVVVVTPKAALAPGSEFTVVRNDPGASDYDRRLALSVAERMAFGGVECWSSDTCSWSSGKLSLGGGSFAITYTNPVAASNKEAPTLVTVDPPVPNLSVWNDTWSSTGRLNISGGFAPSQHYHLVVAAVRDRFGQGTDGVEFDIDTLPLAASATMAEGAQTLDGTQAGAVAITTRNVERATLKLWRVGDDGESFDAAQQQLREREMPNRSPDETIELRPAATLDQDVVTTVDLAAKVGRDRPWLVALQLDQPAFGARVVSYPSWSSASRAPLSMVTVYDERALAVHTQAAPDAVLVHVARLGDGQPLADATFSIDTSPLAGVTTDADGFAVLPLTDDPAIKRLLHVEHEGRHAQIRLGQGGADASTLAPQWAGEPVEGGDVRAMVVTDRGVYRPGSTIFFKGIARTVDGDRLPPMPRHPVRVRVTSPTGDEVLNTWGWTTEHGGYAGQFDTAAHAEIGRYTIAFEPAVTDATAWATTTVQVAEFEPPRFTVDVDATVTARTLTAKVDGRYLFGAAMDGAAAAWTLRRRPAELPQGDMVGRGLSFDARSAGAWYDDDDWGEDGGGDGDDDGDGSGDGATAWMRSGEAVLDAGGHLKVDQAIELVDGDGPQRFVFEATVQDESHRAIAARDEVLVFDAERYAGVRVTDHSLELPRGKTLELPLELAVADREGNAVGGAEIEAVLERIDWERTRKPGPGGGWTDDWHTVRKEVARCKVKSTRSVVSCPLVLDRGGDYEVTAFVDGRRGGREGFWAWSWGGEQPSQRPGHALEVVADKREYQPGETAKIELTNPFAKAIAIVTREGAGTRVIEHRRIEGPSATFDIPLDAAQAPAAFVTATVLPIESTPEASTQWKFGAVRLPVSLSDARLELAVRSDKPHYAPGDRAVIDVEVTRNGAPVANADVALAVVDEGVLRLTNFHAPDPIATLRPAGGLSLRVIDNRDVMAALAQGSHVAGDGGSEGDASLVTTRKNFVQTALWRPDLVTDADGHAKLELPLPDNLTRFRMMAVVLDDDGRGAVKEDAFEVRKPLMVVPAVPRFAIIGDQFEAAAVVHNGTDAAFTATVVLDGERRELELAAGGHARVAFPTTAIDAGTRVFAFDATAAGGLRDRVEVSLPVQAPGIDERPRLAGSFSAAQDIRLEVPDDVFVDELEPDLLVTMGVAMWPELGERLEFLVDYPHGCVEQTTSSTLPLLAARDLLPRLGFLRYTQKQIDERIQAGVDRLASMRTGDGGLAYWPGTYPSNPYGTAYALRAIVRAEQAGAKIPAGMREGMVSYLEGQLGNSSMYPGDLEVRASVALSLSEAKALPASAADALVDTAAAQGPFGQATLALALSSLPGEDKRVGELLDKVEQAFDAEGKLVAKPVQGEFAYYGSAERTRAQAALALQRLRPASPLLGKLLDHLARSTGSYTTQSTAFGLIALAEHLVDVTAEPIELSATLDGEPLFADALETLRIGAGAARFHIPMSRLRGRPGVLRLRSTSDKPIGFMVDGRWRRPYAAVGTLAATSAAHGPDLYRVLTDPKGEELDLDAVHPGQIMRVTLLARMPEPEDLERDRLGYVAITDSIAAGFEPIQPDLATVAEVPGLSDDHPLHEMLSWGAAEASFSELHDNRVNLYFDRVWGSWVAATYLVRATTPGSFMMAPARVELMYEPDSLGYSDTARVTVKP